MRDDTYNEILKKVQTNGLELENCRHYSNDFDIVVAAVKQNGMALQFAHPTLKNDPKIATYAVKQNINSAQYIDPSLHYDESFIMDVLRSKPAFYRRLPADMKKKKSIAERFVRTKQDDYTEVLYAVNYCGRALKYASATLRDNETIALAAITNDRSAYFSISLRLKEKKELIYLAVEQHPEILAAVPDAIKNDIEIVQHALKHKRDPLRYVSADSHHIWNDRETMTLAALNIDMKIDYLSARFRADEIFMRVLVAHNPWALDYATDELKNNASVVNIAVKCEGNALRLAGPDVKNNKKTVTLAFTQNIHSMRYAHDDLAEDQAFALQAVQHNGRLIRYFSQEIKENSDIACAAIENNGRAIIYIARAFQDNPEWVLEAGKTYLQTYKTKVYGRLRKREDDRFKFSLFQLKFAVCGFLANRQSTQYQTYLTQELSRGKNLAAADFYSILLKNSYFKLAPHLNQNDNLFNYLNRIISNLVFRRTKKQGDWERATLLLQNYLAATDIVTLLQTHKNPVVIGNEPSLKNRREPLKSKSTRSTTNDVLQMIPEVKIKTQHNKRSRESKNDHPEESHKHYKLTL
jgi:hypothetical protein